MEVVLPLQIDWTGYNCNRCIYTFIWSLYNSGKPVIIMSLFKEEGVYCFANVGLSVDHTVSAGYLENHTSQSLHISHM